MTRKNIVRLLALAAITSAFALPASAQWGPEEEKNCFTKPGTSGSLTLSAQGGNGLEDSSKLQEYETIPKGVFVPCATFTWTNDKDYFIDARGTKLGLDDQFASVFAGKKGGRAWRSSGTRTPTGSPTRPRRPTARRSRATRRPITCPTGCGSRCRTSTCRGWLPRRATPSGIGIVAGQPDGPRLLRRGAVCHGRCPRSTCATCARPARPGSTSPSATTSC